MGRTHAAKLDDADIIRIAGSDDRRLLLIPLLTTVGLPEGRVLQPPISWGGRRLRCAIIAREHTTHLLQSNLV